MTKDEALKLALEALEQLDGIDTETECVTIDVSEVIDVIKEALAQPEQEPVGKFAKFTDGIWRELTDGSAGVPLYKHLSQRTWLGLTDDERDKIYNTYAPYADLKAIEAKLKEKNT